MSELIFEEEKWNNRIRVHSKASCGKRFKDVASIYEPDSKNPALDLNGRALGIEAVSKIVEYVKERKKRQ